MSIFSSQSLPRPEDTYTPYYLEKPDPYLFVGGAGKNVYATTEAPSPTEEEASSARNYIAALQGGKNWSTAGAWFANEITSGVDQARTPEGFVNRDAAMWAKQILAQPGVGAESVGVGAAFADSLAAVRAVIDPNFSAESNFDQWKKDNAGLYRVFQQRGVDETVFTKNVQNSVWFNANIEIQTNLVRAADIIDARNSKVTGIQQAWESTAGMMRNYVLNDPVGLGVNVIPVAGTVGRAGELLGFGARSANAARLSLIGQSVVKLAPSAETLLISKTGQLALSTVEMGILGGVDDTIFQTQEVQRTNQLWGGTDQALDYSFTRTAAAVGGGMAFNVGLHAAAKGLGAALGLVLQKGDRLAQTRQAALVAHGGAANSPVARNGSTAVNIARDYADDAVKMKIAEHMDNISPNATADPMLGWVMEDRVLGSAGLAKEDVLHQMQRLSDVMGDNEIHPTQLNTFFQDWFVQAKGVHEGRGFAIAEGPQAVRYRDMVDQVETRIIAEGGVQPTDRAFIPGTREFREKVRDKVFTAFKSQEVSNIQKGLPPQETLQQQVTRLTAERDAAIKEARTDPLTGVGNRKALEDNAARLFGEADESGQATAAVVSDIANFKPVNDSLGHDMGDKVLIAAARAKARALRDVSGDRLADSLTHRTGGDELAALLRNVDSEAKARVYTERVQFLFNQEMDQLLPADFPAELRPTLRFGAEVRKAGDTRPLSEIMKAADDKMTIAKSKEGAKSRSELEKLGKEYAASRKTEKLAAEQPKANEMAGAAQTPLKDMGNASSEFTPDEVIKYVKTMEGENAELLRELIPNEPHVLVEVDVNSLDLQPLGAREEIDAGKLEDARDLLAAGGTAPPIVVSKDMTVPDGAHRVTAYREAGKPTIGAVMPKSLAEAMGLTPVLVRPSPAVTSKNARYQKEFLGLIEEAKRRDLLLDEEARMMALEDTLEKAGALPDGYKKQPTLPKKREMFDINKMKSDNPATASIQKLLKEQQKLVEQTEALAQGRSLNGEGLERLTKDRDNTLARIRRILAKMKEEIPQPSQKLSEVLRDIAANPPASSGERTQALVKMLQSAPEDRGLRVQDIHAAAQIMRAWGMGDSVSNLILQKTGQMNGTRSMFASIRELFDFMDHATLKVEDVSPRDRQHVGTLADKKRESVRLTRELDRAIEKHLKSGAITDWNKTKLEFVLHANGAKTSTDEVVLDLYKTWEKSQKEWMQEGLGNGYLGRMTKGEQAERFFPRRWLVGVIRRNNKDFQNIIYENLLKQWQTSDILHKDTMVALGWARRTQKEGIVEWEGIGAFAGKELPIKRTELDPALLPIYEQGLTKAVNQNGENALQQSAWRTVNHILSEDTPKIDQVTGKIIREDVGRAASEIEKRLPATLLQDVRTHKYLDTNIMDIAQQYAEGTGFAIKAQSAVQQKWGIPGATLDEWIDAVKIDAEGKFRGDGTAVEKLNAGLGTFRNKYLRMRGKNGSLISANESILQNMAAVGTSLGNALFSPGIAILSMFADTFVAKFAKIHSPVDFWRNVAGVFESIFTHKGFTKEHLHDLAMGSMLNRQGNVERYTSGQLNSTFSYSWGSRMTNPWKEVVTAFSGKTQGAAGVSNRAVLGSMRTLDALAKNISTLFGGDFWFSSAAAVQVAGLKRETAQYMKAAIKLSTVLKKGGWDELAALEMKATADALAKKMSRADAVRLGQTARAKAFNLKAREAGFGPNWHIPTRMNQHGLLDPDMLQVLQEAGELTGGISGTGIKSFMDLNTIAQASSQLSPEKQLILQDAIRSMHNMVEADANKIMNVPGILQTPTDPSARTYIGKMLNMYTGYMRTFASNHILGMANVPATRGFALIVGFLLGETLARTARRLLNGEPWEDINEQWKENPKLMMTRTLMQVPFFGEWSMAPQLLMEAGMDGPLWKQDSGSVPAGALNDMFQLAREGIASPYQISEGESPRVLTHADRIATRLVPGLGLARSLMGENMSRDPQRQRYNMNGIMERTDLEWERRNNWDDSQVDTTQPPIWGTSTPGVVP